MGVEDQLSDASTAGPATPSLIDIIQGGRAIPLPGAPNALTARIIEETGFEALYVTGAGIANTYRGEPDIGLVTLTELTDHVAAIRDAVQLPLIVDAETGFGSSLNVWRTIRDLERAGADCIQIEDQTFPKRCGHFEGTSVIEAMEMVDKLAAALDARRSSDLLLIARTDARSEHGLEEACRRANLYREAGADIIFVEAPRSEAEVEIIAKEVDGPKMLNIVQGGATPPIPLERVEELGFSFALYANLPLLASIHAMHHALSHLRAGGSPAGGPELATWDERQMLVRKAEFDALSARFGGANPAGA